MSVDNMELSSIVVDEDGYISSQDRIDYISENG